MKKLIENGIDCLNKTTNKFLQQTIESFEIEEKESDDIKFEKAYNDIIAIPNEIYISLQKCRSN